MIQRFSQSPSWLFAFVDLAFLMLIVMTQVADGVDLEQVELGEIALPLLQRQAASDLPGDALELWQVRVHPPKGSSPRPFELIGADGASSADPDGRLSATALHARLDALRETGEPRPLLAPDRRSESQHLLEAIAAIEERWPSRQRSALARLASS